MSRFCQANRNSIVRPHKRRCILYVLTSRLRELVKTLTAVSSFSSSLSGRPEDFVILPAVPASVTTFTPLLMLSSLFPSLTHITPCLSPHCSLSAICLLCYVSSCRYPTVLFKSFRKMRTLYPRIIPPSMTYLFRFSSRLHDGCHRAGTFNLCHNFVQTKEKPRRVF